MPYKNPERKRQWVRLHRSERLTRRRELRQAEAAREDAQPEAARLHSAAGILLLPLAAGGALAAYNPKLERLPSQHRSAARGFANQEADARGRASRGHDWHGRVLFEISGRADFPSGVESVRCIGQ